MRLCRILTAIAVLFLVACKSTTPPPTPMANQPPPVQYEQGPRAPNVGPRTFTPGVPVSPIQHNPFTITTNDPAVTVPVQQPVSITTTNAIALEANGLIKTTNTVNGSGNVLSFGATGDGFHDDTVALQRALDSLNSVHFPKGRYLVTDSLYAHDNQVITGLGQDSVLVQSSLATRATILLLSGVTNCTVSNLAFEQIDQLTGNDRGSCVGVINSSHFTVKDCYASHYGMAGVYLEDADLGTVSGNHCLNATTSVPIGVQNQTTDIALYKGCHNILVSKNFCVSGSPFGIGVLNGADDASSDYNTISENVVTNHTAYGILLYLTSTFPDDVAHITGCEILNNIVGHIDGSATNIHFPGNHYYGAGIYLQGTTQARVAGNTIFDTALYNRHVLSGDLDPGAIGMNIVYGGVIENNTIFDAWNTGIEAHYQGHGSHATGIVKVANNTVKHSGRWVVLASGIAGSTNVTVSPARGFMVGDPVTIEGAGLAGANQSNTVYSVTVTNITLTTALVTTVSSTPFYLNVSNDPRPHGGIVFYQSVNVEVTGNTVEDCWPGNIFIYSDNLVPACGNVRVILNEVRNAGTGIHFAGQTNFTAAFNKIVGCSTNGIYLEGVLTNGLVQNNEFSGCTNGLVYTGAASAGVDIHLNQFSHCLIGLSSSDPSSGNGNNFFNCVTNWANPSGFIPGTLFIPGPPYSATADIANLNVMSTNGAPFVDMGGGIGLGGYCTNNFLTTYAYMFGRKLNSVAADIAGYWQLLVRGPTGTFNPTEVARWSYTNMMFFKGGGTPPISGDSSGNFDAQGLGTFGTLGVGGAPVGVRASILGPTGGTMLGTQMGSGVAWQIGQNIGSGNDNTFSWYSSAWGGGSLPMLFMDGLTGLIRANGHFTVVSNLTVNGTSYPAFSAPSNIGANHLVQTDGVGVEVGIANTSAGALINNGAGAFTYTAGNTPPHPFTISDGSTNWTFAVTNGIATITHSP